MDNSNDIVDGRKGVSNTTLAVLVVLALTITIIGTWAVLNSMSSTPVNEGPIVKNTNIAKVSLTILPISHNQDVAHATLTVKSGS